MLREYFQIRWQNDYQGQNIGKIAIFAMKLFVLVAIEIYL